MNCYWIKSSNVQSIFPCFAIVIDLYGFAMGSLCAQHTQCLTFGVLKLLNKNWKLDRRKQIRKSMVKEREKKKANEDLI